MYQLEDCRCKGDKVLILFLWLKSEGKSECRANAFFEPGPAGPGADFASCSRTVFVDPWGLAVALLEHEARPNLLPRNVHSMLPTGRRARSDDYRSLRRKDGSGAEARGAAS